MVLLFFVCRLFGRRAEQTTDRGYKVRHLRKPKIACHLVTLSPFHEEQQ